MPYKWLKKKCNLLKAGADPYTAVNCALDYENEVALQSLLGNVSRLEAITNEHSWLLCPLEATNDEHSCFYGVNYETLPSPLDYLTSSLTFFGPPISLLVYHSALLYDDRRFRKC